MITPVFEQTIGIETYATYEREDGRTVQMTVLHPNFLLSAAELVIVIGNEKELETENYHCYLTFSERQAQEIRDALNSSALSEGILPSLFTVGEMLILRDFLNRPEVQAHFSVRCSAVVEDV